MWLVCMLEMLGWCGEVFLGIVHCKVCDATRLEFVGFGYVILDVGCSNVILCCEVNMDPSTRGAGGGGECVYDRMFHLLLVNMG